MKAEKQLQAYEQTPPTEDVEILPIGVHVDTFSLDLLMNENYENFRLEIKDVEREYQELQVLFDQEGSADKLKALQEKLAVLEIKRSLLVKLLWRKNDYNNLNLAHTSAPEILTRMTEILEDLPVFVTETVTGSDTRGLYTADSIIADFEYLNKNISEGVEDEFTQDLKEILGGRYCYTRPGLEGLQDVLTDSFIIKQLLDKALARNDKLDISQYIFKLPISEVEKKGLIKKLNNDETVEDAFDEIDQLMTEDQREEYKTLMQDAETASVVGIVKGIDAILQVAGRTSLERIDISSLEGLSLELQCIVTEHPEVIEVIESLQEKGVELRLERLSETSPEVLEAINRIAVLSQENYLLNWLPQLVTEGKMPNLTITENGRKRGEHMGLFEKGETPELTDEINTIQIGASQYLRVIDLNDTADEESKKEIEALNVLMAEYRNEYARGKMLFDNANERTHDAQEVIKKMMYVGPIAHALELLNLGSLAKLFASSADDLMGEYAEIKALMGSGFSLSELYARMKVLVPVFAMATYSATQVEVLLEEGHEAAAGALFGVSAVALSLTTAIQSIKMYKHAYEVLLEQGKIDGKISPLVNDESFQESLKKFLDDSPILDKANSDELMDLIESNLELMGEVVSPEERAQIMEILSGKGAEAISQAVSTPSNLEIWKQAIRQDFSNPARLGIMIGSSIAPLAGMIAAEAGGMHNGFIMAGIGSTESVVAGLTVIAAKRISEFKYQLHLKNKLEDLQKAQ